MTASVRVVVLTISTLLSPKVLTSTQTEVTIANIIVGVSHVPLWIADRHGFITKRGVHANIEIVESAASEGHDVERLSNFNSSQGGFGGRELGQTHGAGRPLGGTVFRLSCATLGFCDIVRRLTASGSDGARY